jgi:hypothetical protein
MEHAAHGNGVWEMEHGAWGIEYGVGAYKDLAFNFHMPHKKERQLNVATMDYNLDQIASSVFRKLLQEKNNQQTL